MVEKDASKLLDKYYENKCSQEEIFMIESWYFHMAGTIEHEIDEALVESICKEIWDNINPDRKKKVISLYRVAAAAAVLVLVLGSLWYFNDHEKGTLPLGIERMPVINKAILELADGREIYMDSTSQFQIATQEGVIKAKEGTLIYPLAALSDDSVYSKNKLTVPLGGKYQITLPDGSTVYLNAGSSLTYSTKFSRKERSVKLEGEGYFEIVKDISRPFKVNCASQIVRVLGTHFNVSCYPGELVKTTLLEGKVKISLTSKSPQKDKILDPNQQAILSGQDSIIISKVNAEDVILWKDGSFVFSQTPIIEAFRQISRSYNVAVDYNSLPKDIKLEGCSRENVPLSELLKQLSDNIGTTLVLKGDTIKAETKSIR
ncbi:FecR family protein [Chitinophaga sp. CF118]|uniref:FecR family protein n=1 Tax=Chitinophaga sp. CF118 TaxID=1884367 RepID=UPI0008E2EE3F|nr:FecR family protein [Chitinophaga sp. CF118]SFF08379.1 FecR family protein [Chitinophaga sp. CF118]